jgi:hypothetical protein
VLDVRPITLGMLSVSRDPAAAENAVSWSGDDGLGFAHDTPAVTRSVPVGLRYRVDRMLADGVLFAPSQMEHKWAVFHHLGRLLFVRSWQRQLMVAASTRHDDGHLEVVDARGCFSSPDEPRELTIAIVDFIIRTHALGQVHPAPLERDPGERLEEAGLWCMSMFGNLAWFATHHPVVVAPPDAILRSDSLYHIAIAKGDHAAAGAQLDAGIPIDLLDRDGLSAMHWALAAPGTDTLDWLTRRGLAVDTRSDEGTTTLMVAVQQDDNSSVAWLLAHGSDPNASDARGFTSLHRAAEMGHAESVRLLLEHGARRDCEARGYTPVSLARSRGHPEIVSALGG